MAGIVYSQRLFSAPGFSGAAVVQFTAPTGFRTVVKTLTAVWGDVTISGLDCWVQLADGAKIFRRTITATLSDPDEAGGSLLWYGGIALEAGETLATQTAEGTVDFIGSGYLLSLP